MTANILVLIGTGAIGQAIIRRTGAGRKVLLADLSDASLAAAKSALASTGYDVTTHRVDVSSRESVEALAAAATELGPVTGVVHTAGLSPAQAPVQSILAVDLVGTAY